MCQSPSVILHLSIYLEHEIRIKVLTQWFDVWEWTKVLLGGWNVTSATTMFQSKRDERDESSLWW